MGTSGCSSATTGGCQQPSVEPCTETFASKRPRPKPPNMALARRSLTSPFTRLLLLRPSPAAAGGGGADSPLLSGGGGAASSIRRPPPPRSAPNFPSPLHLLPFPHRLFSSSAASPGSGEITPDVADVITDTSFDAAAAAAAVPGEVAAAAADSWPPVAALQYFIDGVHSFTGLNWWAAIVVTTLLIRGAAVPILVNQMKSSLKLAKMRPELEVVKAQMDNSLNPESIQEGQKKMKALFLKHGVTPFTPLKGMFIQAPIFISFFLAISNMAEKVPSFKEGGAFWFLDLTTPDPIYALPVLTSLTFLATVEFNMQEGMEGNPMAKTMKKVSRFFGLMTIPLTANFPKAIFFYWITSNIFSLTYGIVMRRPPVRKFLNLPDVVPPPENPAPQPSFSFSGIPKLLINPVVTKDREQVKTLEPRLSLTDSTASSSYAISKRIKNLEKKVKSRSKSKKR